MHQKHERLNVSLNAVLKCCIKRVESAERSWRQAGRSSSLEISAHLYEFHVMKLEDEWE
jgi:hypothetical protein